MSHGIDGDWMITTLIYNMIIAPAYRRWAGRGESEWATYHLPAVTTVRNLQRIICYSTSRHFVWMPNAMS